MSNGCKGRCEQLGVFTLKSNWYNLGLKKCSECRMCYEKKYQRCPCCGYLLSARTSSGVRNRQAFPVRYVD